MSLVIHHGPKLMSGLVLAMYPDHVGIPPVGGLMAASVRQTVRAGGDDVRGAARMTEDGNEHDAATAVAGSVETAAAATRVAAADSTGASAGLAATTTTTAPGRRGLRRRISRTSGTSGPPPAPPKRSRAWLWILVIVVVGLFGLAAHKGGGEDTWYWVGDRGEAVSGHR